LNSHHDFNEEDSNKRNFLARIIYFKATFNISTHPFALSKLLLPKLYPSK